MLKSRHTAVPLLKEIKPLLDTLSKPIDYDNYRAKQKRLALYFASIRNISGERTNIATNELIKDLETKADHLSAWLKKKEWLGCGFFNGYYDNAERRVEGKKGGYTRMMLASQVFAIMSGIANDEQIKQVWLSIKKYLKDKGQGGFRLNTDFGSTYLDFGRAFGFAYGDKENGAFFSHMNVMLANALYRRGFVKEGYEVLSSIYHMATKPQTAIYPGLPEYFNNEGKGLYPYLTGSASWYISTFFEQVLGINMILGDILLEPKLMPEQFRKNTIEITFAFAAKHIKLAYICPHSARRAKKPLTLKKVLLEGKLLPLSKGKLILKREILPGFSKKSLHIKAYMH